MLMTYSLNLYPLTLGYCSQLATSDKTTCVLNRQVDVNQHRTDLSLTSVPFPVFPISANGDTLFSKLLTSEIHVSSHSSLSHIQLLNLKVSIY